MSKFFKITIATIGVLFIIVILLGLFIENKAESTFIQEMAKQGGKAEKVECSILENECSFTKFSVDNAGDKITIDKFKFNGLTSMAILNYKMRNDKDITGEYSFDAYLLNLKINNQDLNIKINDNAFPELNNAGNVELIGSLSLNVDQNKTNIKTSINYIAEKLISVQLDGHFVFSGDVKELQNPDAIAKLSLSKVNINLEQRNSFAKKLLFVNYLRKIEGATPKDMISYHKSLFNLEDVEKSLVMSTYVKHLTNAYEEKAPEVFKTRFPTVKVEHTAVLNFIKNAKSDLKIEIVNLNKRPLEEDVARWIMSPINPNDFIVTVN